MLIGEAIKSIVSLKDTNIRRLAKKVGMSYQTIYESCNNKTKKGMHTTTATKLLDALDYQMVVMPKGTKVEDEWLKIDGTSEGSIKIYRKCIKCGKAIKRNEYSVVTQQGRFCQDCVVDMLDKKEGEDND
jgi:hypothetical protein